MASHTAKAVDLDQMDFLHGAIAGALLVDGVYAKNQFLRLIARELGLDLRLNPSVKDHITLTHALIHDALADDVAAHKQWYLFGIAETLSINTGEIAYAEGVEP